MKIKEEIKGFFEFLSLEQLGLNYFLYICVGCLDFKGENYVFSINYDSGCCLHMWVDVIHPLSSFGR